MRRVAQAQRERPGQRHATVYYKHWKAFADWCFDNCFRALPAHVDTVSLYLTERADTGTKVATLGPVLAAIRHYHEGVELTSPTTNPRVKKTLKGLAREYPCKPAQVTGLDRMLSTPSSKRQTYPRVTKPHTRPPGVQPSTEP